ncbi:MAG: hypothetical protein ACLQJR_18405 [Stellaceae bacterium]
MTLFNARAARSVPHVDVDTSPLRDARWYTLEGLAALVDVDARLVARAYQQGALPRPGILRGGLPAWRDDSPLLRRWLRLYGVDLGKPERLAALARARQHQTAQRAATVQLDHEAIDRATRSEFKAMVKAAKTAGEREAIRRARTAGQARRAAASHRNKPASRP